MNLASARNTFSVKTCVCTLVFGLLFALVTSAFADSVRISEPGGYIGADRAREIALSHAGVSESDLRKLEVELKYPGQGAYYEVEFDLPRVEYEYHINAWTGEILNQKVKRR